GWKIFCTCPHTRTPFGSARTAARKSPSMGMGIPPHRPIGTLPGRGPAPSGRQARKGGSIRPTPRLVARSLGDDRTTSAAPSGADGPEAGSIPRAEPAGARLPLAKPRGEVRRMRRAWGRWLARVMIWLVGLSTWGAPLVGAVQASFLLGLESYARGW